MVDNEAMQSIGQLRRGAADRCVLAILHHHESYGFDLAKTLADAQLIAGEGTIYPLLSRLRREGLVDTRWSESPHGPPRRYYVLTRDGEAALDQFRTQWSRFRHAVDTIMNLAQEGPNDE